MFSVQRPLHIMEVISLELNVFIFLSFTETFEIQIVIYNKEYTRYWNCLGTTCLTTIAEREITEFKL